MKQKIVFSEGEGDAWFERNKRKLRGDEDEVVLTLQSLRLQPKRILEIGCSNGYRLEKLRTKFDAQCAGIDPSKRAIADGRKLYNRLSLDVGTADELPFDDSSFDVVIFGFCLYLCDPSDHFLIAAEADRVLSDPGWLAIYDFIACSPQRQPYSHRPGVYSYKMEFSRLFTSNAAYRMIARRYLEHGPDLSFDPREAISIDIVRKDSSRAF